MTRPAKREREGGLAPAAPRKRATKAAPAPSGAAAVPMPSAITVSLPTEVLERLEAVETALDRLRDEVAGLGLPRDVEDLRSSLDLIAERLASVFGGPTLTELMDRIDEVERKLVGDEPPKRRRRA